MAAPKSKNLIRMVLSRIFLSFNLTKNTTQQKALVLLCVAGTIFDPLFFYIPMIKEGSKCTKSDRKLGVIAICCVVFLEVEVQFLYPAATAASKEISQGNPNSLSPFNSKAAD